MVLGFCMVWVGCVFFVNTACAFGKVDEKETAPWNIVIGALIMFIVAYGIVTDMFGSTTFWWATQVLLFAMTYLMLGIGALRGTDGRGMGWFCLFVALTVPFPAAQTFLAGDVRVGIIWVLWGILWLLFFIMMALGKTKLSRYVKYYQLFNTIFTLWLPGVLMLCDLW